MIQYLQEGNSFKVRLDGKIAGKIKSVDGGWQYFPSGSKKGGEIYTKLEDVMHSLENPLNYEKPA